MCFNQIMDNQYLMGEIYSFDSTYHDKYKEFVRSFGVEGLRFPNHRAAIDEDTGLRVITYLAEFLDNQARDIAEQHLEDLNGNWSSILEECLEDYYRMIKVYKLMFHLVSKARKNPRMFLAFLNDYRDDIRNHFFVDKDDCRYFDLEDLVVMMKCFYPDGISDTLFNSITQNINF